MERHVYADFVKDKTKIGFVCKGNVVFLKLWDAENYCRLMNYPVDNEHLKYSPNRAKEIAITVLPELDFIIQSYETRLNELREEINRIANERDGIQVKSILDEVTQKILQDKLIEIIGQHSELTNDVCRLRNRSYELFRLSRMIIREE